MHNRMKLLSESDYKATFSDPMSRLQSEEGLLVDIWPYFERIPKEHFLGHDFSEGGVKWVWENSKGTYQLWTKQLQRLIRNGYLT